MFLVNSTLLHIAFTINLNPHSQLAVLRDIKISLLKAKKKAARRNQ